MREVPPSPAPPLSPPAGEVFLHDTTLPEPVAGYAAAKVTLSIKVVFTATDGRIEAASPRRGKSLVQLGIAAGHLIYAAGGAPVERWGVH